jgi:hypothetical protein
MQFETRAMKITVRPDDIIELNTKESWNQPDTVEIALENIEMLKKAVEHGGRAMLSYMPGTYVEKDVLECYKQADIGHVASALLTKSFGSRIVGNLFLKLIGTKSGGKQPVVTKIFSKREEAEQWLLQKIKEHKIKEQKANV